MTERVIWLAGWTLLFSVVCAMAAIATLGLADVEQVHRGIRVSCRPFDVMLGRDTACDGWPTGRTMPMLLAVAAIAAWGVPERRRGHGLVRVIGCVATAVAGVMMLVVVGDLDFAPRAATVGLLWGVMLGGLVPLILLPFATRRDAEATAR